jgi:hypothetical protein
MQEVSEHNMPNMAPGCYASPSVYASDSEICRGCPTFDDCAAACVQTLHALRDRINIDSLLARHKQARSSTIEAAPTQAPTLPATIKFMPSVKPQTEKVEPKVARPEPVMTVAISEADQAIIETLNKKSKEVAIKWCKRGMIETIKRELSQGRNPFASQARLDHCSVVCEELLNGAVTKHGLKKAFMKKLGAKSPWDESTAGAHVGIAMPVLVAFGIAIESPEGFIVNPAIGGDNV